MAQMGNGVQCMSGSVCTLDLFAAYCQALLLLCHGALESLLTPGMIVWVNSQGVVTDRRKCEK